MSHLSGQSSSSGDDAGSTRDWTSMAHVDELDEEEVELSTKFPLNRTTSASVEVCNRLVRCRICGEDFGSKAALILHLRDKHSAADKFYKCESCHKSFPSSQQLTQHMLVHTNVRRYQCQYCDKAFKQLSHVQQHERIHTGELPYHCPVSSCERSFRQLSSMKQHLKGHGQGHSQSVTSSSISSASSPSSEPGFGSALSPKMKSESMVMLEEPPDTTISLQYHVPDSSSGLTASSLSRTSSSSESDSSRESSHGVDEEERVSAKKWREDLTPVTPLYQQSLIDLSSKLGEIKRRQRKLRLCATILP